MKKMTFWEEQQALNEAYYKELEKIGIKDTKKEEKNEEKPKKTVKVKKEVE